MKRTHEKSSQPVTSPKPTTLNLQTRAFAPTSSDSSQVNRKSEDTLEQSSNSSSENLLGKLISTPSIASSNHSIQRKSLHRFPIQAKLNIGEPNDKYEKEADATASKVVQQINSSPQDQSIQRQDSMEQDEIQMKPIISKIQREESMEDEDEELQMKSLVQKRENVGGEEASNDLESSIQSVRGRGQSLDANLQEKMGQAMGADFSGVKVHTDSQSDQLNKSIQAKAFTTGQDVFFRQGAYEPSSRGGQELIAHELTHVVQQEGTSIKTNKPVQRKLTKKLTQSESQHLPITNTQSISLQAAFEPAYVNDTAQLHNINSSDKDTGTVSGGKKLKAGEQIEADESDSKASGEWIGAKAGGKTGYIRKSKIVFKRVLVNPTDPDFDGNATGNIESVQEPTDKFGGGFDAIAGGLEVNSLKSNQNGKLNDIDGSKNTTAFDAKSGLDIVSGTGDALTGLFGMAGNALKISRDKTAWENLEAGYGFVESLGKSTSGATKIVDSIAKASGAKDGVGQSDVAGKITGAIADGLSGVKNAAMGVIGIYKLFKSQSDEKGKDALVTFKALVEAAGSAAKVAKNAFDIIGNGIPMSIIYTVPALGIAVSAINLLIRLWDAIKAGNTKSDMMGAADPLRLDIASTLGEGLPNEDNVDNSKIFDKDRRGTFPAYKTYFRTKKPVREAIKGIATFAQTQLGSVEVKDQNLQSSYVGPKTKEETEQPIKDGHAAIKNHIDSTALDGGIKDKLKTLIGQPKTVDELRETTVKSLAEVDQKIDTYEYVDKMSEINQKRQVGGWTDVILELVSMAGDIVTIAVGATGIGAAIGQGVKAASAGYKVVHGSAKFVQKLYRNRGDGSDNKSSMNKHKEYAEHARFVYQQVSTLTPGDTVREKQLEKYIRATGVNYGMWLAVKHNPQTQVEMLVEAMKQR
ncbi:MAG: DUF4157 domain-containing protein [Pseudanabaena sp. M165S2SP1A06QC]|nr:DUF4157 domain-containing protein [Pseudanabaena sp. M165S2SP1A06QC]